MLLVETSVFVFIAFIGIASNCFIPCALVGFLLHTPYAYANSAYVNHVTLRFEHVRKARMKRLRAHRQVLWLIYCNLHFMFRAPCKAGVLSKFRYCLWQLSCRVVPLATLTESRTCLSYSRSRCESCATRDGPNTQQSRALTQTIPNLAVFQDFLFPCFFAVKLAFGFSFFLFVPFLKGNKKLAAAAMMTSRQLQRLRRYCTGSWTITP